jgi:hypothetical protein
MKTYGQVLFLDPVLVAKLSFERKKMGGAPPRRSAFTTASPHQINCSPSLKKDRLRPFTHLRPLLLLQPAAAPLH